MFKSQGLPYFLHLGAEEGFCLLGSAPNAISIFIICFAFGDGIQVVSGNQRLF